jgi:hypothetical protein
MGSGKKRACTDLAENVYEIEQTRGGLFWRMGGIPYKPHLRILCGNIRCINS